MVVEHWYPGTAYPDTTGRPRHRPAFALTQRQKANVRDRQPGHSPAPGRSILVRHHGGDDRLAGVPRPADGLEPDERRGASRPPLRAWTPKRIPGRLFKHSRPIAAASSLISPV